MKEAVIVSAVRTPMGKAHRGSLANTRAEDLGGLVVEEVVKRTPGLSAEEIEDVIIGCAMPEGEQGLNMGRIVALRAGLPDEVPGLTINRFCSSGLQSIAFAAERIMSGFSDVIVAGGVESMSHVPMSGFKPQPNPYLVDHRPEVYISMGNTAENVAKEYEISREKQDAFAASSHQKAATAIESGKFKEEIVPVPVKQMIINDSGKREEVSFMFDTDEGVRPSTSPEVLSKLRPAFLQGGSVTAGNASQMNDGASAVVVMSREKADQLGLKPLAIFRSFAVGGVVPEVMGIGPVVAIPKALELAGVTLDQIDLFEINEAFAAQCVAVMEKLQIDPEKVNVNGGAIALGHPLGCTGAKLTTTLLHEAKRRNSKFGVVSMCIGGGMGAAGVFEFV
ncbi:acetyl-CoA C-acyltransferase [Chengkuizengella axinellae]|uniref:acetyl-CoA C-acyltransferase n=1 Tax=Chengkuizengella axinellae TaxID=3064388 RepID=A0ABT9IU95_9BACL|nr:acetyl-CoA C-acyltransferase [Chengkuizengella sp. 2205SS18-9]MDP5272934.1 acetyl-CoA C-acyltransferase [Chengkuizengella sp. 2205SS18-9]